MATANEAFMDAMDSMSKKSDGFGPSVAWWRRVVWWIALAYLVFRAGLFARLGVVLTGYPFDVDYNEGFTLNEATLLANGARLYKSLAKPPYYVTQYTPLYPFLGSLAIRAGLDGLAACRLLSMAATVGVVAFIFLCARFLGSSRLAAALAGLTFVASTYVVIWGAVAKADMTGLFWGLLGVYLAMRHCSRSASERAPLAIVAAAVCCALGLYTRQSFVAAPLAVGLALWVQRRRAGILFTLVFLGLSGVTFVCLEWATAGQFHRHIFNYTLGTLSLQRMLSSELLFLRDHAFTVLAGVGAALWLGAHGLTLPHTYLAFALAMSLTCGRFGASSNYFIEALAALCVWSALGMDWLFARRAVMSALAAAALIMQCSWAVNQYQGVDYWLRPPSREEWRDGRRLVARLHDTPGMVMCEFNGFTVKAGRTVWLHQNAIADLVRRGLWDDAPVVQMLRNGSFAFIACDPVDLGRWTPEMMDAMRRSYTLVDWFLVYQIDGQRQLAGLAPNARATERKR